MDFMSTVKGSLLEGFYPAGEGAGYAGGSMSAAVDGIRVAQAILTRYKRTGEDH